MRALLILAAASIAIDCADVASGPPDGPAPGMDFQAAGFWEAPFPSAHRVVGGAVDLSGFPNPDGVVFVEDTLALLDGVAPAFGRTSAIYFPLESAPDPTTLPSLAGSLEAGASVFLVDVDPDSPGYGERAPLRVAWLEESGPFADERPLLAALPLQGAPLRPDTAYAAAVTRGVSTADGDALVCAPALWDLLHGDAPAGLAGDALEAYRGALDALDDLGVDLGGLAAIAAFTTGDPEAGLDALVADARAYTPAPLGPFVHTDSFDDFCAFESSLEVPVYQAGEPPYLDGGGDIDDAAPAVDHFEEARIFVTLPRGEAPAGGWPVAVMSRTGGGGDRPMIDRGVRDADGELTEEGGGPARAFARAGYAGVMVDGPHGGVRNVSGGDEQFLMFNITNPAAMRDNVRQSALELALLPDVIAALSLDGGDCGGQAIFTLDHLALMGHSMGATIAPLTLAVEPRYEAAILSGAGGSWIENIVYKESPLEVRPLAEAMLGYLEEGIDLTRWDPALTLTQWAGESADPPAYARRIVAEADAPRHVLMLQGIVDTYILPPIANAASLSIGLDLAGEALDAQHPDLAEHDPLGELLPLVGGQALGLPAGGNRGGSTALVIQHAEDGVEDGHEVAFQLEAAKQQYQCFLAGLAGGAPEVPAGDCAR